MIEQVEKYLKNLQNDICDEFGSLDSKSSFDKDVWERDDGRGRGVTLESFLMGVFSKKVALTTQLLVATKCQNQLQN